MDVYRNVLAQFRMGAFHMNVYRQFTYQQCAMWHVFCVGQREVEMRFCLNVQCTTIYSADICQTLLMFMTSGVISYVL